MEFCEGSFNSFLFHVIWLSLELMYYSQYRLIRPKIRRFSVELTAGFNIVNGVCRGESVEPSGLIELTVAKFNGSGCITVVHKSTFISTFCFLFLLSFRVILCPCASVRGTPLFRPCLVTVIQPSSSTTFSISLAACLA